MATGLTPSSCELNPSSHTGGRRRPPDPPLREPPARLPVGHRVPRQPGQRGDREVPQRRLRRRPVAPQVLAAENERRRLGAFPPGWPRHEADRELPPPPLLPDRDRGDVPPDQRSVAPYRMHPGDP